MYLVFVLALIVTSTSSCNSKSSKETEIETVLSTSEDYDFLDEDTVENYDPDMGIVDWKAERERRVQPQGKNPDLDKAVTRLHAMFQKIEFCVLDSVPDLTHYEEMGLYCKHVQYRFTKKMKVTPDQIEGNLEDFVIETSVHPAEIGENVFFMPSEEWSRSKKGTTLTGSNSLLDMADNSPYSGYIWYKIDKGYVTQLGFYIEVK